jgi:hypothetical protein
LVLKWWLRLSLLTSISSVLWKMPESFNLAGAIEEWSEKRVIQEIRRL